MNPHAKTCDRRRWAVPAALALLAGTAVLFGDRAPADPPPAAGRGEPPSEIAPTKPTPVAEPSRSRSAADEPLSLPTQAPSVGDLCGTVLAADGQPAANIAYEWRDTNSVVLARGTTNAQGEWLIPTTLAERESRFLRVIVPPVLWLDFHGLQRGVRHALRLPALAPIDVRMRLEEPMRFETLAPRLFCQPIDGPTAMQPFLGSPPRTWASAVLTISAEAIPVSAQGCRLLVPSAVYRLTCVADTHDMTPPDATLRPPAAVVFEPGAARSEPTLCVVEGDRILDSGGVLFLFERIGQHDSVTQIPLRKGVAIIPAGRVAAMRSAGDVSHMTIILTDGRMLSDAIQSLEWDGARRVFTCRAERASQPTVVHAPACGEPRYVVGRRGPESRFTVNGGVSLGEPRAAAFARMGDEVRLYRLPDDWRIVKMLFDDGTVANVQRQLGNEVDVTWPTAVRTLEVEFEKSIAPLVTKHGRIAVKFEVKVDAYPDTLTVAADSVILETPGDCHGKVWRKAIAPGAEGRITAHTARWQMILAQ